MLRFTIGLTASLALTATAVAQEGQRTFSSGYRFVEMSGEELYNNVCRACHMLDAKGATGAGAYPSLAANPNLEAAGYPLTMVIHGRRAMPPFGDMMNDAQIAAVVNYLRTHFGNNYTDMVTAQDVSDARH
ncbi:MAG: cytochrome c [Bradyrhizobium sp.]|nr:cytochrome c [Bradyrhizobium sp.]